VRCTLPLYALASTCLPANTYSGVELECGESFSEVSAGILPLASALPLAVEAPSRCPPAGAVLSPSGQGSGASWQPHLVADTAVL
jgi:hypothetical protein